MQKLFFFGDSISFGHMVSIHKTWPALVAKHFERTYICNNPSVNGNTTKDALNRMSHDIESHVPNVVYIQFGLNDANFWETDMGLPRISRRLFKANLQEIARRLQHISPADKIILATNHLPTKKIHFLSTDTYRAFGPL